MPRKSRPRASVPLPKGVHRVVARGREFFYYQAHRETPAAGPRIPLPKDPYSENFWIELRKAQGVIAEPAVISAVLDEYFTNPLTNSHFRGLAPGTQRQYLGSAAHVRPAWGNLPASGLRPKHIRVLLDTLADRPGIANNLLGFLRAVSKWGLERGHFDQSISEGVQPYKTDGGQNRGRKRNAAPPRNI